MRALVIILTLLALLAAFAPVLLWSERPPGRPQRRPLRLAAWLRMRAVLLTDELGSRFFRRGKSSWYWVTTLTSETAPTATQINAGVKLDKAIADLSGFDTQLNRISEPWWDSNVDIQTDGPQQLGDAQMVFFDDDGTGSDADSVARQAVKAAMVEQATGFLVNLPLKKGAAAAADDAIVFPAKIGAVNTDFTLDVRSARYTAQFAITGTPTKDAVVA